MNVDKVTFFKKMFDNYTALESKFDPTWEPWNLSSPQGQAAFKKTFAEYVEELSELYEYVAKGRKKTEYLPGMMDEVVDVFNFATQMAIRSGFNRNIINVDCYQYSSRISIVYRDNINIAFELMNCIYKMGMVTNLLKNRPWKKSHFPLDREEFNKRFNIAYNYLITVLIGCNFDELMLENAFLDKHNKIIFRKKSGY